MGLCAQANHNCCSGCLQPHSPPHWFQQGTGCFNGKSFLAGASHVVMVTGLCLPLLTEVLGISLLHPLVKLSCSPYGMGLTEPLIPTSCTTQISCPQDHAQQRAVRWKSSGAPSRRTGVALGNQEHNSMLLSAALRLSPAPAPMCAEVRPELKMKSLQRYFNRDLMLN